MAYQNVHKQFEGSKFIVSIVGILKLVSIVLFLIACITFLSAPGVCPKTPEWYPYLFPFMAAAAAVAVALLFSVFALGLAKRSPNFWTKLDALTSILLAGGVLTTAIVTMSSCGTTSPIIYTIPGPFGIAGSLVLAVSAAWLFIVWKSSQEDNEPMEEPPLTPEQLEALEIKRKSIHV